MKKIKKFFKDVGVAIASWTLGMIIWAFATIFSFFVALFAGITGYEVFLESFYESYKDSKNKMREKQKMSN